MQWQTCYLFFGNYPYGDDGLRLFGQENNHIEIIFHPSQVGQVAKKK
jgi:hypothetical protein